MPTKAAEIRARARKLVKLPSGYEVEIRKIHLWDFVGLGELPLPPTPNGDADEKQVRDLSEIENLRKYSIKAIVKGAISPKFVDEEVNDPEAVHVDDLDQNDFQALAEEILRWSGLGREEAEQAAAFRDDGERKNGPGDGGNVRETSDRDS